MATPKINEEGYMHWIAQRVMGFNFISVPLIKAAYRDFRRNENYSEIMEKFTDIIADTSPSLASLLKTNATLRKRNNNNFFISIKESLPDKEVLEIQKNEAKQTLH